jgi:hypothetical protein
MQDQFPIRERFRTLNALTNRYGQGLMDNNGYIYTNGHLALIDYPLHERQAQLTARKINELYHRFFRGCTVYYAVIPDKNYFLENVSRHLYFDYGELLATLHTGVNENVTNIDILPYMSLDSFYRTDIHWRQEAIHPVAHKLAQDMGMQITPYESFTATSLYPFYGGFHGHAALPIRKDTLVYLSNEYINNATVRSVNFDSNGNLIEEWLPVYRPELINSMDGYDVFLSGGLPFIEIYCDTSADRELIIFRDSFGSSIAPLLLGGYAKITLVDLRYMSSSLIPQLIETNGRQDVLFLYSTGMVNRGGLLR